MERDNDYKTLLRRIQTLESRLTDLAERVSAYQSGTDKNPNTEVFVSDGRGGAVGKIEFDAENDDIRVTRVRQ